MKPEQLRNSVGVVSPRDFTFEEGLRLQCGQLLAPINLRYETYGRLSPECDNAILIEHALSGFNNSWYVSFPNNSTREI